MSFFSSFSWKIPSCHAHIWSKIVTSVKTTLYYRSNMSIGHLFFSEFLQIHKTKLDLRFVSLRNPIFFILFYFILFYFILLYYNAPRKTKSKDVLQFFFLCSSHKPKSKDFSQLILLIFYFEYPLKTWRNPFLATNFFSAPHQVDHILPSGGRPIASPSI